MIGYYPHVIVALLPIYLHSTNQTLLYSCNLAVIKRELRKEKHCCTLSKNLSNALGRSTDIACDTLDVNEKRQLCDSAMQVMITKNDDGGGFGSFLETESETDPVVPQLANAGDSYTCTEMPIEGINAEKRMYWCNSRRYTKYQSDEIGQAEGFFIAGSRKRADRAFMFTPSPTNDAKVIPRAKIEWVDLLSGAQKS